MSNEKKTITQRKSNKSVKTAVLLFGAVLLTTSLLGGTLAKYTGDVGKASDSARVAKWNVDEDVKTFDLFSDSYVSSADGNGPGEWKDPNVDKNTVQADEDTKVIAPGTKGEATIAIDPDTVLNNEVAFQYNLKLDPKDLLPGDNYPFYRNGGQLVSLSSDTTKGWNAYLVEQTGKYGLWFPLQFNVIRGKGTFNEKILYQGIGNTIEGDQQVRGLRNALISEDAKSEIIYPKTDVTAAVNESAITIEWEWVFNQNMDKSDTQLGINAVNKSGDADMVPNFLIDLTIVKTQVD